jgi:hypothetical protein
MRKESLIWIVAGAAIGFVLFKGGTGIAIGAGIGVALAESAKSQKKDEGDDAKDEGPDA